MAGCQIEAPCKSVTQNLQLRVPSSSLASTDIQQLQKLLVSPSGYSLRSMNVALGVAMHQVPPLLNINAVLEADL